MVRHPSCPICSKTLTASSATESEFFPFCSQRCREVDLLRWSDGRYAIVEPLSDDQLLERALQDGELDPEDFEEL